MKKLNAEINLALAQPDVITRLQSLGLEPNPLSPSEFARYVRAEVAKWAKIIKTIGITAD